MISSDPGFESSSFTVITTTQSSVTAYRKFEIAHNQLRICFWTQEKLSDTDWVILKINLSLVRWNSHRTSHYPSVCVFFYNFKTQIVTKRSPRADIKVANEQAPLTQLLYWPYLFKPAFLTIVILNFYEMSKERLSQSNKHLSVHIDRLKKVLTGKNNVDSVFFFSTKDNPHL